MSARPRIGVLASGGGTTYEAVNEAIDRGSLEAEIAFVVCNNRYNPKTREPKVYARTHRFAVPAFTMNNTTHPGEVPGKGAISTGVSEALANLAQKEKVHMLVGLGYMKRLFGAVLEVVPVGNEHPAPLPLTAGLTLEDAQKLVMSSGAESSGPTFHWMSTETGEDGMPDYDAGEVIGHWDVPILGQHRREWEEHQTVELLKDDVQEVERIFATKMIGRALDEL